MIKLYFKKLLKSQLIIDFGLFTCQHLTIRLKAMHCGVGRLILALFIFYYSIY